jgi:hypothetical protein
MGFRPPKLLVSALQAKYIGPLLAAQMCIAQVAIDLRKDTRGTLLLYSALGILAFGIWISLLISHLVAIQRSQLWVLSFLIGQALMAWAFYMGSSTLAMILFVAVIAAQIPFALLLPPSQFGITGPDGSSEPLA